MRGHSGQVRWSGFSGGLGPWVRTFTEAQPSRWELPRQSALVAPPPRGAALVSAAWGRRVGGRRGAGGRALPGGAALAVGVAEAVGARVAAAQDHDVLVLGADLDLRVRRQPGDAAVLLHEVVHREVD